MATNQRLIDHLAVKVCGWVRDEFYWRLPNGGICGYRCFDPMRKASDTEIVIDALRCSGIDIHVEWNRAGATARVQSGQNILSGRSVWTPDWRHAVCLAIATFTGWEELPESVQPEDEK